MNTHTVSRTEVLRQRFYLFRQLVKRDIERRYKATFGGMAWAILQPLLMIGIYTIVFGLIFKPRWPAVESPWDYVLILFLGKVPYLFVTESMAMATASMRGHINLVKKAVFPLNLLPGVSLGSSMYHSLIALAVWVVFFVAIKGAVPWAIIALPLLWLPLILFCMGACWVLAALGAYFRDTDQVVGTINIALMFLSPIFYPSSSVPHALKLVMMINPLTHAIEWSRAALLWPAHLDLTLYPLLLAISAVFAVGSLFFFNRLRPGFADVL
ncbi:ABC transporter permease [Lysobacter auxotrophicus]|uniref:Transport permease protein n=1 Tax=Lysobacter auxotrophicus TaxID=2992573 RepID=A0ABN6UGR2_9GAMM|nr:ABC transporter permease [Lysobacter auxotrophicus]BDU15466.1 ABC transporter permease [Lysobacter auxotrophicus]